MEKKLATVVEQVQKEHAIADVEVWTMDEQRLGLKPVRKGCVGSVGRATDCECVFWRFQWLWLYGFVHQGGCGGEASPPDTPPQSRETKRVDFAPGQYQTVQQGVGRPEAERLRLRFAKHFGLGKNKRIVLSLDQAGWHKARASKGSRGHPLGVDAFPLTRVTTCGTLVASD